MYIFSLDTICNIVKIWVLSWLCPAMMMGILYYCLHFLKFSDCAYFVTFCRDKNIVQISDYIEFRQSGEGLVKANINLISPIVKEQSGVYYQYLCNKIIFSAP